MKLYSFLRQYAWSLLITKLEEHKYIPYIFKYYYSVIKCVSESVPRHSRPCTIPYTQTHINVTILMYGGGCKTFTVRSQSSIAEGNARYTRNTTPRTLV
jgi:hypothetical protein